MRPSIKYCVVPLCKSTTTKTPEKLFFYVPKDPKIRKKWTIAMRRAHPLGPKTIGYCCEDHFDVEKDMENYIKHKLVGGPLKLKRDVYPHKFACQHQHIEKPEKYLLSKLIAKSSRKEVWCKKNTENSSVPPSASSTLKVRQYKRKPRKTKELALATVKNETISVDILEWKQSSEQKKTEELFLDSEDNKTFTVVALEGNQSSEQMITMEEPSFLDSYDHERMSVNPLEGRRMSTEDWNIERDLCRCCHSEGTFKSLSSICSMETDETYSDLLTFSLDIKLCPVSEPLSAAAFSICEVCIARLRDAHCFKTQVLKCETHFQNMYQNNCIKVARADIEIKEELLYSDEPEFGFINGDNSMVTFTFNEEELGKGEVKCEKMKKKTGPKKENGTKEVPPDEKSDRTELGKGEVKCEKMKKKKTGPKKENGTKKVPRDEKSDRTELGKGEEKCEKVKKKTGPKKENGTKEVPRDEKCDKTDTKAPSSIRSDIVPLYELIGDTVKCLRCNKISTNMDTFNYHFKTIKLGRYRCKHCGARFCSKNPLTKHKIKEHSIDDRIKCNACDKYFDSQTCYKYHMQGYHKLGEKISCPQCDFECFTQRAFKRHMITHDPVKVFNCKFCKKSFKRQTNLNLHEKIHTGERTKVCNECGQAFVQKASLNYHMVKYHPEVKF